MGARMKRRLLGWIQTLLAMFGAVCLGFCAFAYLDAWWLDQRIEIHGLDEASATGAAAPREPGAVVGRVRIPRLDIDAVVLEGTEASTLRRAVGRISSTRLPWESGTVGLAAHRDSFFRALRRIEVGDLVQLATGHGTWTYRVTSLDVVDPGDARVLDDRDRPALVLVTCYPFDFIGPAPRRFVVHAERVQPARGGANQTLDG